MQKACGHLSDDLQFQVWDVGGRLQSSYLKAPFFQMAAGIVLIYDARNPLVLESLDFWHDFVIQKVASQTQ